jgi:hypothetical protein
MLDYEKHGRCLIRNRNCLPLPGFTSVFYVPATKWPGHDSVTHVRNSEIKQLQPLFFAMLWDIDLILGMGVYDDKLQSKFTFRSSPMIFGQVMALGLGNLAKYLFMSPLYFTMIWDIDLIFGMRVYNHKIIFEIHLLFLAYYWGN